jgi:hypothetical protein
MQNIHSTSLPIMTGNPEAMSEPSHSETSTPPAEPAPESAPPLEPAADISWATYDTVNRSENLGDLEQK